MDDLTDMEREILADVKRYYEGEVRHKEKTDYEKSKHKSTTCDGVSQKKKALSYARHDKAVEQKEWEERQQDYLEALLRQKMIDLFNWPDTWFEKMTSTQKLHAWAEIGKHQALTEALAGSKKRGPKKKRITDKNKTKLVIGNIKNLVAVRRPDLGKPTTREIYDLLFDKLKDEEVVIGFKKHVINCGNHVERQHFENQVSSKWTIPKIRPISEK